MSQFWPSCISGTSHTPCWEVPSALLPVCSAVSPAYKNFSCSPSFFSSSFLFSFLVFCLVHQSKSQVSSQVRSRLLNQLGLSSALLLPCHIPQGSQPALCRGLSCHRPDLYSCDKEDDIVVDCFVVYCLFILDEQLQIKVADILQSEVPLLSRARARVRVVPGPGSVMFSLLAFSEGSMVIPLVSSQLLL